MAQDARIQFSYKTGDASGRTNLIAGFPNTRVSAGTPVATLNWHEREQREE